MIPQAALQVLSWQIDGRPKGPRLVWKLKDETHHVFFHGEELVCYGSDFRKCYPLVICYITMERSTIFHGKIHYNWPFSIAMLNYQRVWWDAGHRGKMSSLMMGKRRCRHGTLGTGGDSTVTGRGFQGGCWCRWRETSTWWWMAGSNAPTSQRVSFRGWHVNVSKLDSLFLSPQKTGSFFRNTKELLAFFPYQFYWMVFLDDTPVVRHRPLLQMLFVMWMPISWLCLEIGSKLSSGRAPAIEKWERSGYPAWSTFTKS